MEVVDIPYNHVLIDCRSIRLASKERFLPYHVEVMSSLYERPDGSRYLRRTVGYTYGPAKRPRYKRVDDYTFPAARLQKSIDIRTLHVWKSHPPYKLWDRICDNLEAYTSL